MSAYGSGGDADALSRRLRDAERSRADAERAHADALASLRAAQRSPLDAHGVEQLQSRARELEKKAALETVRCEELQLELSAAMRARSGGGGTAWSAQPASEIERIMAKIEQDNRILAELEHSRSTTHGIQTSGSNQGLGEYHSPSPSPLPHQYQSHMSHGHTSHGAHGAHGSHASHTSHAGHAGHAGHASHAAIGQSSTMPALSALHATGQFSAPSSNSVAYSMSSHNPTSYTNPVASYSANSYGLSNPHQVTFTNPVAAPLGNNMSQISSTLAGLQSNLHNITSNMSGMNLGSGLGGASLAGATGLTSCLNNAQTSLAGGLAGTLGMQSSLGGGLASTLGNITGAGNMGLSTSYATTGAGGYGTGTYTNPLLSSGLSNPMNALNIKLKPVDEIDMAISRYGAGGGVGRVATPVTPHQTSWGLGLDSQYGTDRLGGMDAAYSHERNSRALVRMPNSGLDMDVRNTQYMNGGGSTEGQVDMLDIPGKGRCCVYMARFSYDPPDIETAEGELSISNGDYLLVWGPADHSASMLDAELLDGRRGLVPANFVTRLVGDDLLEFHQAVVTSLRDTEDISSTALDTASLNREVARLSEMADIGDCPEDDDNVPAPRQLTLERQLNKSVLIGWTAPEGVQQAAIESYHVYVDGVLKTTVKASERTRALVEGVDSNRPHRISVRSVTTQRRTSRDAACTMVIGRDTCSMGPTCVRAGGVTCSQAIISWLPANSNHQHVVCVNNVEVRTVKPGVYRHTITGLSPSTQYRVTVRAKHLRAGPPSGIPTEEAPGAYTDFRTLPKGLPDPPAEIMVEAGPQDGTLLVTWQPVLRPPASGPVTGYAVYADGKKVTDVDSPTGDHALIDIGKLIGLNPKCVTVRTKSRDSQSSDSTPTPIPPAVLRGVVSRMPRGAIQGMQGPNQGMYRINQQAGRPQTYHPHQQHQQVMEHDENLSDKEIFPSGVRHDPQTAQAPGGFGTGLLKSIFDKITPSQPGVPAIEITKEAAKELGLDVGEMPRRRSSTQQQPSQPAPASQQPSGAQHPSTQAYHGTQQPPFPPQGQYQNNQPPHLANQQQQQQQPRGQQHDRSRPTNPHQVQQTPGQYGPRPAGQGPLGPRGSVPRSQGPYQQTQGQTQKKCRYFMAIFDYDPTTMSPNPEGADEELPFTEGEVIKVYGDKDGDGFYWGESRNRRGYVPNNMVVEVSEQEALAAAAGAPKPRPQADYAHQPVRRMIAMYDYDPQELSPNVDSDAELSFQTGQIVLVYGDMDDDGFYMGEIDGQRGLVPSNFLSFIDPNDQYQTGSQGAGGQRQTAGRGARPLGPGARGPPPPPRENVAPAPRTQIRKADACPLPPSQLDHNTSAMNPEQANSQARGRGGASAAAATSARPSGGSVSTPLSQSPAATVPTSSHQSPLLATSASSPARRAGPAVVPAPAPLPPPQPAQPPPTSQPNLMQKFSEMTAPGGDILSKGKELIFMKFGLGGK